jgi:hypothetical protein
MSSIIPSQIFVIISVISSYGYLFPVLLPEVEINTIGCATGAVDYQGMFSPRVFFNGNVPDKETGGTAESYQVPLADIQVLGTYIEGS